MPPRKPSPRQIARARAATKAWARAARKAEADFTRTVVGILKGFTAVMVRHLGPAMKARAETTKDAAGLPKPSGDASRDVDAVVRELIPQIGPKVSKAHAAMVKSLHSKYASTMKDVVPITVKGLPPDIVAKAEAGRDASIQLVEEKARMYAQDVRDIFGDPNTLGMRVEDLQAKLMERGNISESRAQLVARDQTLKLAGQINQARQEAAGVDSYIWDTSGDERVRDEHAELDGQVFSWNDPPEPGHPGQDFQCRCVALPYIPDLEGI